ncbi:hypothetical protein UA08_08815 [Talaromyces atroroseus]|uniref:Transcription factor domain-containing protein n=1 Tax=Talaromyces atroroseus TaxID=1441469 RepID=A0A225A7M3_TALAT|nr:hypothetical protein UA08_08815 [Talaromyces atroroseus]OKL55820.1 hypothetical protein UA08_08815 [Talaromyces atroroseus]
MTIILYDGRRRHTISPAASPESQNRCTNIAPQSTSNASPELAETGWLTALHIPLNLDDVFLQYTRSKLFQGSNRVDVVLPAHVDRSLMTKAFLALCTTFFGLEHKEKGVIRQGFQRYGHALEHIHRALEDPVRCASFDLLESIAVMSVFEFIISDDWTGWLSHLVGLEKLFSFRGPESFITFPELLILEKSRVSIITSSLLVRRHTILSNQEWKAIPWTYFPERKNSMELLVDILADCPALFADQMQLLSNRNLAITNQVAAGLKHLLGRAYRLLDQLEKWKEQWDLDNPGYCHEIPAPFPRPTSFGWQGEKDMETPIWTTILNYASVYHANTMVLYDGTLILLLRYIQGIMNELNILAAPTDRQSFDLWERSYAASLAICRSVEYHLQGMRRGVVDFHLMFPLRMANQTIGDSNPAIGLWIQDVLQQIRDGQSSRWTLAKYLLEVQTVPGALLQAT